MAPAPRSLLWDKAPYGRQGYYTDVPSQGRYYIERLKGTLKWTAKLNGQLKAQGDSKEAMMDYVSIEADKR